ncbi:stage II sporulation protein M [Streptomyces sp. NBC_00513]|uniref:stage II sporulation protein M n=1 Tax=unclassified Streptomyces TaxID=2593676 RepID=UPI00224D2DCA|nr:stage II sporulation protein M [Streptomyces sp. NBC_00424]MCX5071195.1 stage II sporulation protein M [Streptomyces sp. NBC_00424]WUD45389.1 stage II sporulation protein M [Streptomyces sp. NBC_00513]
MGERKASLLLRQQASIACGALLWFGAFAFGWWNAPAVPADMTRDRPEPGWTLFSDILMRNVGVSAALFLGIVTFGLATIPAALITGSLAGYGWGQAAPVLGTHGVIRHLLPHMPLELASLALSTAAGLVPIVGWARSNLLEHPRRPAGWAQSVDACRLWAVSVAGLLPAAGVETWVST